MKWAAIDFETANQHRDSACAIGVAFVDDGQITGTCTRLIRPQVPTFNPFNIGIHGISASDVADAPEFDAVWRELWPQLEGRTLFAHNAPFDVGVLRASFNTYGMPHPEFDYFCTVALSRLVWPDLMNHKLPTVAGHIGFSFDHHDPEADAVAAAKIGLAALDQVGVDSIDELGVRLKRPLLKTFGTARQWPDQSHSGSDSSSRPVASQIDVDSPFFGKHVVVTGALQGFTRTEATRELARQGATVGGSVTRKTDVVVVAGQDLYKLGDSGISTKLKKARELVSYGVEIELISEDEFVRRLFGPTPE
jgi:DNA polymerase-3 subunit epsilon